MGRNIKLSLVIHTYIEVTRMLGLNIRSIKVNEKIVKGIYKHESLITIFEEGKVLELNKPDWYIVLIHEETCEQHEWNDKDWSQGDSKLLISKESTNDKSIRTSSSIYKNQNSDYKYIKQNSKSYGKVGTSRHTQYLNRPHNKLYNQRLLESEWQQEFQR